MRCADSEAGELETEKETMIEFYEFYVPIRTESEMNKRDHWTMRRKRFEEQKAEVRRCWPRVIGGKAKVVLPVVVTLTRIAPRRQDDDNAISGMKACRDQIAALLGADDGSALLTWRYGQERGKRKEYAVRIRIEPPQKENELAEVKSDESAEVKKIARESDRSLNYVLNQACEELIARRDRGPR